MKSLQATFTAVYSLFGVSRTGDPSTILEADQFFCYRMRVLWISCLLIGSITCVPLGNGYGPNSADTSFTWQPSSGYGFSGRGVSSDPGSSSSLPSLPYPNSNNAAGFPAQHGAGSSTGTGSYMSPGFYGSTSNNPQGEAFSSGIPILRDERYSPMVGNYGAAHAVQPSGYGGIAPGVGYMSPRDEGMSAGSSATYGAGEDNSEPVFSDVSDLEPVYSFSSRSQYQRGRLVFAQSRYTPEEPAPPSMPVYRHVSKTSPQKASSTKGQSKGGF